jgi:hypothetical protein
MGRNLDRGLEDWEEKQRSDDSKSTSEREKVVEQTRKDLYRNLNNTKNK